MVPVRKVMPQLRKRLCLDIPDAQFEAEDFFLRGMSQQDLENIMMSIFKENDQTSRRQYLGLQTHMGTRSSSSSSYGLFRRHRHCVLSSRGCGTRSRRRDRASWR